MNGTIDNIDVNIPTARGEGAQAGAQGHSQGGLLAKRENVKRENVMRSVKPLACAAPARVSTPSRGRFGRRSSGVCGAVSCGTAAAWGAEKDTK
jgi:hypothetical protein